MREPWSLVLTDLSLLQCLLPFLQSLGNLLGPFVLVSAVIRSSPGSSNPHSLYSLPHVAGHIYTIKAYPYFSMMWKKTRMSTLIIIIHVTGILSQSFKLDRAVHTSVPNTREVEIGVS
jgi:hypothetical protein